MANPRKLTTDEAVEAIVTGDHAEGGRGSVAMDAALVQALRGGKIEAAKDEDGKLLFRKPE